MQITPQTLRLSKYARPLERKVQGFLCPIYGVSGSVGSPIGSGFLLQLSSAAILITAAHVLHEMQNCVLHTRGKSRIIPIEGTPYSTGPRPQHPSPEFGLDLGFIVLDETKMEQRPACVRVRTSDLDLADI